MSKAFTILQLTCVILVSLGILVEYRYHADIGYICITSGSLAFGVSTKIRKIIMTREIESYKRAYHARLYEVDEE